MFFIIVIISLFVHCSVNALPQLTLDNQIVCHNLYLPEEKEDSYHSRWLQSQRSKGNLQREDRLIFVKKLEIIMNQSLDKDLHEPYGLLEQENESSVAFQNLYVEKQALEKQKNDSCFRNFFVEEQALEEEENESSSGFQNFPEEVSKGKKRRSKRKRKVSITTELNVPGPTNKWLPFDDSEISDLMEKFKSLGEVIPNTVDRKKKRKKQAKMPEETKVVEYYDPAPIKNLMEKPFDGVYQEKAREQFRIIKNNGNVNQCVGLILILTDDYMKKNVHHNCICFVCPDNITIEEECQWKFNTNSEQDTISCNCYKNENNIICSDFLNKMGCKKVNQRLKLMSDPMPEPDLKFSNDRKVNGVLVEKATGIVHSWLFKEYYPLSDNDRDKTTFFSKHVRHGTEYFINKKLNSKKTAQK